MNQGREDLWTIRVARKILARGGAARPAAPAKLKSCEDLADFLDRLEAVRRDPWSADLEFFLRFMFGKEAFRPGQREAVCRLLGGRDALVALPTGAGKSLVFQLAAMLRPGTCLVVEPTLSLIDDQLGHLAASGLRRALAVTSEIDGKDELRRRLSLFASGEAQFCYVTPERLATPAFRAALSRLGGGEGVCLVVVDEAHCVSEWGHDFRTAYLTVGRTLERCLPGRARPPAGISAGDRERGSAPCSRPPVAALSATFSERVLREVAEELKLRLAPEVPGAVAPAVGTGATGAEIVPCESSEKPAVLRKVLASALSGGETSSGIIFCPHVDGPFGVQETARSLRESMGIAVETYHGRPPAGCAVADWARSRREAARRFQENRATLLVATKAFGLGIDKQDVRFTIHLALPASMEAWRQEAGRAGRDGAPARAWILASIEDERRALRLSDPALSADAMIRELDSIRRRDEDDVVRSLRFHSRGFRGLEREARDVIQICRRLGDLAWPGRRILSLRDQYQPIVEKALYRLLCLGIISDYAVRYPARPEAGEVSDMEYEVEVSGIPREAARRNLAGYARGLGTDFQPQLVPEDPFPETEVRELLRAVYATIEASRRRALLDAVLAALGGSWVYSSVPMGKNAMLDSWPLESIPGKF